MKWEILDARTMQCQSEWAHTESNRVFEKKNIMERIELKLVEINRATIILTAYVELKWHA